MNWTESREVSGFGRSCVVHKLHLNVSHAAVIVPVGNKYRWEVRFWPDPASSVILRVGTSNTLDGAKAAVIGPLMPVPLDICKFVQ